MPKVWLNLAGTTAETFSLGKGGPTVHHGSSAPINSNGVDGDLYVQTGASPGFFQRSGGIWRSLVPSTFQRQQVSSGSTGTVLNTTTYVAVVFGTANPTTINLPTGTEGMQITIKDEIGLAQNYNIVIKNGPTTVYTIASGYGAVSVIYTNGSWYTFRKVV